jgi:hypothetical protein
MCCSEAEVDADSSVATDRVTNAGQALSEWPANSAAQREVRRALYAFARLSKGTYIIIKACSYGFRIGIMCENSSFKKFDCH